MIINDLEHIHAKTKKTIKVLKGSLSVGLSGVIISGGVLLYSGMKEYDIKTEFGSRDYYGYEIINGEARKDLKYQIFDYYEENIGERMDIPQEVNVPYSYNEYLPDDTVIELNENVTRSIIWSLYRDPDFKDYVTIGDLKRVTYLEDIWGIDVNPGDDLSWLNYCESLKSLELEISSYESLQSFKGIKRLNVNNLIISTGRTYKDAGVKVDEEFFSFLKQTPYLSYLEFESPIFNLTSPFLNETINKNNEVTLMLNVFSADAQKIDVNTLLNFKKIQFDPFFSDGLYDIAAVFTKEDINKLLSHGIELNIMLSDFYSRDTIIRQEEFLTELNNIYEQIDEIIKNLNVSENMSEEEKIKKVVNFVVENLKYSETSSEIQDRIGYEGITPNMFGKQDEELVNDLEENSYKRGYLYGALDANGKPVCGSYSALTNVLLRELGVETYRVHSDVHAWNLINVNGEYYFLDTTAIDTDQDIINLDQYLANNQHLLTPIATEGIFYQTKHEPAGVNIYEMSEEKMDVLVANALKKYNVILNGQICALSITSLMSLLSIFGLAISAEKFRYLTNLKAEKNCILYGKEMDINKDLPALKALYEASKKYWKSSTAIEKTLLKASGIFDLEEFEKEISMLEANNRNVSNTINQ